MNTFFKSTVYAAFVGLTIFSSCSDEIKDFTVKPDGTEQGDGSATTAETKNLIINATATGKKWVVEDVIYVGSPSAAENEVTIDNQSSGFTKFTVSKIGEGATSASFEGEIPANLSGKKLLVFYGNTAGMKVASSKVTIDLTSQSNTIMSAVTNYSDEESINATFSNNVVSFPINLSYEGITGEKNATITFDDEEIGFISHIEFDSEGKETQTTNNNINASLDSESENSVLYIAPTKSVNDKILQIGLKVIKTSGDYLYNDDVTIESGKTINVAFNKDNLDNDFIGDGTENNPRIIDNIDKFKKLSNNNNGEYYRLSRDLSFEGSEYTPITTFAASLDGNNFTLSDITINESGLINTNTGNIYNLNLDNVTVNGGINAGILAAIHNSGSIINCHVKNSNITTSGSPLNVGGLIGNSKSIIKNSSVTNTKIKGTSTGEANIGGLVGKVETTSSNITGSYVDNNTQITIEGGNTDRIGGFIGSFWGGNIYGCYSNTSITSYVVAGIGGFIGLVQGPNEGQTKSIKTCYAIVNIDNQSTGNTNISDFIGNCFNAKCTVSGCYSLGSITGTTTTIYGLCGSKSGDNASPTFNSCYTTIDKNSSVSSIEGIIKVNNSDEIKNNKENLNSASTDSGFKFEVSDNESTPLIIIPQQ